MRELLAGEELAVIVEAHDALSARIVEEAGLRCIWASGLAMSAALGMRDANEASVSQILDVLERMADATSLPILVDGDTGFGNFNNARLLVKKLCQRGLAGVVIEDKLFPKSNSFVGPDKQLADVDEVCGKLRAMCDARPDDRFAIVARTEALIAGRGLGEAMRRAEAFRAAGADAIVIHSKAPVPDEVLAFAARWEQRAPLIAIPTTYPAIDLDVFRQAGFRAIICANHTLRAAISAMRASCAQIKRDGHAANVERTIAPLRDIFALTNVAELQAAETKYLPPDRTPRGLVLGNGRAGDALAAANVQPIEHRDELPARLEGPIVIARAELQLGPHVVPALLATPGELVVVVDPETRRFAGVARASAVGAAWLGTGSLDDQALARVEAAGHHVTRLRLGLDA